MDTKRPDGMQPSALVDSDGFGPYPPQMMMGSPPYGVGNPYDVPGMSGMHLSQQLQPGTLLPAGAFSPLTDFQQHQRRPLQDLGSQVFFGVTAESCPPLESPTKRVRFSYLPQQVEILEGVYSRGVTYPDPCQRKLIATFLKITEHQTKIWFQNRRRRDVVGNQHPAQPLKYVTRLEVDNFVHFLHNNADPKKKGPGTPYQVKVARRRQQSKLKSVNSPSTAPENPVSPLAGNRGDQNKDSGRNSSGESRASSSDGFGGSERHSPDTTTVSDAASSGGQPSPKQDDGIQTPSCSGSSTEPSAQQSPEAAPSNELNTGSGTDEVDMRGPPNKVAAVDVPGDAMAELRGRIKAESEAPAIEAPPNKTAPPSQPVPTSREVAPPGPPLTVGVPQTAQDRSCSLHPSWEQQPMPSDYTHYSRDVPATIQPGYPFSVDPTGRFLSPRRYPLPMVTEPPRMLSSLPRDLQQLGSVDPFQMGGVRPGPSGAFPPPVDQPIAITSHPNPFYNQSEPSSSIHDWPASPYGPQ